jgi:hypothetical protein
MQLSRATILADIPGRDEVLLAQPWTRQVALVGSEHAAGLRKDPSSLPPDLLEGLVRASVVVESKEADDALFAQAYADYLAELDQTPTQLVVVPTLGCNHGVCVTAARRTGCRAGATARRA